MYLKENKLRWSRLPWGWIVLFTIITFPPAVAQVKPLAHYPLDVRMITRPPDLDKQYILRPYDVSGRGAHGDFDYIKKPAVTNFLSVPGGSVHCLDVQNGDRVRLDIPEPYEGVTSTSTYSISFWLYWKGGGSAREVLATGDKKIRVHDRDLEFTYRNVLSNYKVTISDYFSDEGWYHVAFVKSGANSYHYYRFIYANAPPQAASAVYHSAGNSSHITHEDYTPSLLGDTFEGKLYGVRFFKEGLTKTQLDALTHRDYQWAQAVPGLGAGAAEHYVDRGAFAYYPMVAAASPASERAYLDCVTAGGTGCSTSKNGSMIGTATIVDESGRQCAEFDPQAAISLLGSHTSLRDFLGNYDGKKGLTFSFWTYIDAFLTHAHSVQNSFGQTDTWHTFFGGITETGPNDPDHFTLGVHRIHDLVGVTRHIKNDPTQPWLLWMYKPASFTHTTGWYHVVLAYEPKSMTLYSIYPDGTVDGRYNFFGTEDQELDAVQFFAIGSMIYSSDRRSARYIDDFRIYNWAMTPNEVKALHAYEASFPNGTPPGNQRLGTPGMASGEEAEQDHPFSVYPNATRGELNIQMSLERDAEVTIEMLDLAGKLLYHTKKRGNTGTQVIQLNLANKVKTGLHLLRVTSEDIYEVRRILVKN